MPPAAKSARYPNNYYEQKDLEEFQIKVHGASLPTICEGR